MSQNGLENISHTLQVKDKFNDLTRFIVDVAVISGSIQRIHPAQVSDK